MSLFRKPHLVLLGFSEVIISIILVWSLSSCFNIILKNISPHNLNIVPNIGVVDKIELLNLL